MSEYGYCECGCGRKTKLAPQNDAWKGWVKGQPLRFLKGHSGVCKPGPRKEVRFIETPDTNCWEWQLHRTKKGYGMVRDNGSLRPAHRVYYEQFVGSIPEGLEIDHLCRNRACVNPGHLEPVTNQENCRRGLGYKYNHEEFARLSQQRLPASMIAERFGISTIDVYGMSSRLRTRGYDIPYRREGWKRRKAAA